MDIVYLMIGLALGYALGVMSGKIESSLTPIGELYRMSLDKLKTNESLSIHTHISVMNEDDDGGGGDMEIEHIPDVSNYRMN